MADPSEPAALRAASPFRLTLEQQRKRAKELLAALRAGEPAALQRLRSRHPRGAAAAPRLAEAQLVIARELGLPSWPWLAAHVAALEDSRARIRQGAPPPDGAVPTLHLRCGCDIAPGLREAGFVGAFLEYADPLCQGPVLPGADWLEARIDFLHQSYSAGTGLDQAAIAARRQREEAALLAAADHPRVVLWFEQDSYDQLLLARCLAAFAERPPARLELISPGHYPGGTRFIGLGQLPPEALRLLWAERVPVSAAMLALGQAAWAALRAPDPRPLAALAAGTPDLPQLGRALRRHCQELPWAGDGLGLSERLILQLLAEAPRSAGAVFHALMMEREPLPWMTDLIGQAVIEGLRRGGTPLLAGRFEGADRHWPREHLSLTPEGRAVLAGGRDRMALGPTPRWVGGVRIPGAAPCWRWDEQAGGVAWG
ncbi:DUF1835 domain-containing protein [Roseicella frigidaeris]|uniref:DUF1835 domain-containing protein n=1 Tax=Roseicella frigidaeris TaxID=2230885 RepID=UPI001FB23CE9|nr:DUF1835 domain-containing protein [Roseicella frigidaeris]